MADTDTASAFLTAVDPEMAAPMLVAKHGGSIFGGALIALSIVFILIAIIVIATAKTSGATTAGWTMFVLFALVGGFGAFLLARKPRPPAP
jgi:hypothetical protein